MHQTVTKLATTTTRTFLSSPEKSLPPVDTFARQQSTDLLGWSRTHEIENIVDWNLSLPDETTLTHLHTIRATPVSVPKLTIPKMPSRTTPPENIPNGEHPSSAANNNRWRFNGSGQLIDSEAAPAGWSLSEDMGRLSLGDVASDVGEAVHGTIRTPPKSIMPNGTVVPLNDGSPLETSSDVSADSSPVHQMPVSHSRGSSTDTAVSSSQESAVSTSSQTLLGTVPAPTKANATAEVKERPHSFSGGLSSADLRRLQQADENSQIHLPSEGTDRHLQTTQQWPSLQYREPVGATDRQYQPEQPTYPSLSSHSTNIPRPQPQHYEYQTAPAAARLPPHRDELEVDYNLQQRNFSPLLQGPSIAATAAQSAFIGRPAHATLPFRQLPRGFPQHGLPPTPTAMAYGGGHTAHLSLGNTQQIYDMMLPGHQPESHHPAVARVQQQHNVFRPTHHHSASDPSNMRDTTSLALLGSGLQGFLPSAPGMFSPSMAPAPAIPVYPNQFYPGQEVYHRSDVMTAQVMAARLQAQYTGPYGTMSDQGMGLDGDAQTNLNGPSANNRKLGLYKTELCRSWEEKGTCRYGVKCQFAHGEDELRKVTRHPKYKTEICRTFWVSGSCPYGKRCCFIHTELPASGVSGAATGSTESIPSPPNQDGRARSLSTNSDPNDVSVSLLARISAKRHDASNGGTNGSTPVDSTPPNGFQFNARPPTGSLRVDTSALDNAVVKQNKSAYPSFASNGILLPALEQASAKSPVPATAGPDLGRHNNSRLEIVGYNQQRLAKATAANPNVRHSFNGTEVDLNLKLSTSSTSGSGPSPSFGVPSAESNSATSYHAPRPSGHVRSGSAGNWGNFSRNSHLVPSPYPPSSSPAGEVNVHSPWSTTELAVGSSRLHETWA